MIGDIYENISLRESITKQLLKLRETKTWEEIALALYGIIDDISTADDACKENAEAFRSIVMKLQAKKNQYMYSPDGYAVKRVGECVCHIYEMDDDKLIEFYKNVMLSPEHYASPAGQIQYPKDKAEVEREIRKRGLSVCEGLEADVEILVRNELQNDPGISKDELFQNVLDGVKEDVRDEVRQLLPQVYNAVISHYFESKLKEGLTKVQQDTLDKMERGKWYSSYDLQVSLNTLRALSGKGYLTSKSGLGSLYSPRTSIQFKIKENLAQYAQEELKRAGLFDKDSDYGGMLGEAVLALIELFAKQGHSGCSAGMTRELFSRLSNFKPLTEITDDPDEWNDVTEYGDKNKPMWQSQRSPSLFSSDEGKTYWDIDEDYFFHTDENGDRWSGGLSKEQWDNRPMHSSKHIERER